jgi:hypothetical protein
MNPFLRGAVIGVCLGVMSSAVGVTGLPGLVFVVAGAIALSLPPVRVP